VSAVWAVLATAEEGTTGHIEWFWKVPLCVAVALVALGLWQDDD
jgi:hypothetical protein